MRKEAENSLKSIDAEEAAAMKDIDRKILNAQKEVERGKGVMAKAKARLKPAENALKMAQARYDDQKKKSK